MKLQEIVGKIPDGRPDHNGKAGFIPYVYENGEPIFLFMKSSDARFGGPQPAIAKGGIDTGESTLEAGMREAKEELGLKKSNIVTGTIQLAWKGEITGLKEAYQMSIFMGEVKDKKDFGEFHYETESTHWMTVSEFAKEGRKSQLHIVRAAAKLLAGK